jgi:hypothetical protein
VRRDFLEPLRDLALVLVLWAELRAVRACGLEDFLCVGVAKAGDAATAAANRNARLARERSMQNTSTYEVPGR